MTPLERFAAIIEGHALAQRLGEVSKRDGQYRSYRDSDEVWESEYGSDKVWVVAETLGVSHDTAAKLLGVLGGLD